MGTDDALYWNDEEVIELVDVVDDEDFMSSGESLALTEEIEAPPSIDEEKDPLTTATLAEIYISQGFYKRALKIYRDLADQNPDNEGYRRKLLELKTLIDEDEERARSVAVDVTLEMVPLGDIPVAVGMSDARDVSVDRTVAVLEGWLENIRRIRGCRYGNC